MPNWDNLPFKEQVPGDIVLAIRRVNNIFIKGIRTHRRSQWREAGWEGNFEHFTEHVAHFIKNGEFTITGDEDHLANAACRLLLLLQLREEALAARAARNPSKI